MNIGLVRKIVAIGLIIAMAIFLIAVPKEIVRRPDAIFEFTESLDAGCHSKDLRCKFLGSIAGELETAAYGVKRQSISKDDLPMIKLYVDDGSLAKLDAKREAVLALATPVHFTDSRDWVKGKARVEFSKNTEKSSVEIRLKGDWADHLFDNKKMSLRIKAKAGGYLFGMKEFSVQHPRTRAYGYTPLIHAHMQANGIITPRHKFVDLYINDNPIGIMLMEEHFEKEMLESQFRRDGPILAIDEDAIFRQWHINFNVNKIEDGGRLNFKGYRDLRIKDLNGSKFFRGTIETNNQINAHAMLRDFLDGRRSVGETFDYQKLSRYWILTNIWGGCHSTIWHNRRFYFNPMSRLLEPVAFDYDPEPNKYEICADIDVQAALNDPTFIEAAKRALSEISDALGASDFSSQLNSNQRKYQRLFGFESFAEIPDPISVIDLQKNLESFRADMMDQLDSRTGIGGREIAPGTGAGGLIDGSRIVMTQEIIDESFLRDQPNLHKHLSAFYFHEADEGVVEFRNLTLKNIEIKKIYASLKSGKVEQIAFEPISLHSAKDNANIVSRSVFITDAILSQVKKIEFEYLYDGKTHTKPVYLQFKSAPNDFVADPLKSVESIVGPEGVDHNSQKIVFDSKRYDIDENIRLPRGWAVSMKPGAEVFFRNGALLRITGALEILGEETAPVTINIESNLKKNSMGSWGGIFVSQSALRSKVDYLVLTGTEGQNLKNRQGYFGLTGCLSFFESDVDIRNTKFESAQCEDALNIVKSDFTINNSIFENARADAFDSDFSTGAITDSIFENSGNDGIDVSGTELSLNSISMRNIGDKAISVGEDSRLSADNLNVDGAVLGVVSKDRSTAKVSNSQFKRVSGTALMTYIKKPEFGPSSLDCSPCTFVGDIVRTGQQAGTQLIVNQELVSDGKLSPKQMIEAGLIVETFSQ